MSLLLPALSIGWSGARAQAFGQYSTAAIASEAEGAVLFSAGEDELQIGTMGRFQLTGRTDLGLQFGFDRISGINSAGVGADFKFYLLNEDSNLPVDISLDLSAGHFRNSDFHRSIFGIGLISSGLLSADTSVPIEPYLSLGLFSTVYHSKKECPRDLPPTFECAGKDLGSDTETILRGGAKFFFSDEYQILLEVTVKEKTSFGAAINVVF